jgi:beta-glucosidase
MAGPTAVVPVPEHPRIPGSVGLVEARETLFDPTHRQLTMHWKDAWYASLRVDGGAMDLRPFLADGTLEFDLKVEDMADSGLSFAMACGADCGRIVRWVAPSRALAGTGWHHLAFSLRCFARDGDDFSKVTQPFALESSGSGQASFAHVRFVRHGTANTPCPDYRTQSVTPAPLEQVWSMSWWMPRHQHKLDEIAALRAAHVEPELVFIGDSITHNWEKAGKAVWDAHFAKYHALDLGFGGDHTENVLWRLQHGEIDGIRPKAVVLMIGTNNTGDRQEDPRTTAAGIRRLLDEIRARLPEARVLLLAIFPRDEKPDSPLRRINDRVNAQIRGFADDRHVFFLDINAALLQPDGTLSRDVMPDLLHPNEKGYALWAERIEPTLKTLMAP